MRWMNQYKKNDDVQRACSQGGEDGIIAVALAAMKVTSGTCVEIGAWDGQFLSNTIALVRRGFRSIMIEGDPLRAKSLHENAKKYNGLITPITAMVTPYNVNDLIGDIKDGAALSVDIDGGDEDIIMAIESRFAVLVAEWCDRGNAHPWTMLDAAETAGYRLIADTNSNMIFVDRSRYVPFLTGMDSICGCAG